MNPPVVEIRDLIVHAARRCVLDLEYLEIPTGEITAIMGRNGAGKTTLLRSCLGLTRAVRGTVRVLGCDVLESGAGALAKLRRRVGYMPQLAPVVGEIPLTVREVVAIGRTGRAGLFQPLTLADWRIADEWIERLGLTDLRDRSFSEISGGEQRKTIIARTMAQEPELLLFDEPAASLDLGWRERIIEIIQQLSKSTTTVLVCHELETLPATCHNVILLDHGKTLASGSPESVFTPERVASLYGANLRIIHHGGRHAIVPGGGAHV